MGVLISKQRLGCDGDQVACRNQSLEQRGRNIRTSLLSFLLSLTMTLLNVTLSYECLNNRGINVIKLTETCLMVIYCISAAYLWMQVSGWYHHLLQRNGVVPTRNLSGVKRGEAGLAVGGSCPLLLLQEGFHAVLQRLGAGCGRGLVVQGFGELWVQVEGPGRGPAGHQAPATGLQPGLEDLAQLWRHVLTKHPRRNQ